MRTFSARLDPPSSRFSIPAGSDQSLIGLVNRFFFNPADPTSLGLIRICGGLVVLYIHLVYAWGLQSYFGEHGWYDSATANEFRKQFPVTPPRSIYQIDNPSEELAKQNFTPEQ